MWPMKISMILIYKINEDFNEINENFNVTHQDFNELHEHEY